MVLVYLLLALHGGTEPIDRVNVDRIELNVCYDNGGEESFRQLILWDWLPYMHEWGVVCWTMVDDHRPPIKVGDYWHATIQSKGKLVKVRAKHYHETRTHVSRDPERLNRLIWPEKMRRGL